MRKWRQGQEVDCSNPPGSSSPGAQAETPAEPSLITIHSGLSPHSWMKTEPLGWRAHHRQLQCSHPYKALRPVQRGRRWAWAFLFPSHFIDPMLLRYNWCKALCKCKVYSMMTGLTNIMKICPQYIQWTSTSHIHRTWKKEKKVFFPVMRTLRTYSHIQWY